MTRKDYIAIAGAIRATQERIKAKPQSSIMTAVQDQLRGVRRAAAHIADALKADSPRFDPVLFLNNCGYGPMQTGDALSEHNSRQAWADREETERQPRTVKGVQGSPGVQHREEAVNRHDRHEILDN